MPKKMNWSQARHRTDTGRTQDKVDYPDPAAAPLGTDEEAGGERTPQEEIAKSVKGREADRNEKRRGNGSKRPGAH